MAGRKIVYTDSEGNRKVYIGDPRKAPKSFPLMEKEKERRKAQQKLKTGRKPEDPMPMKIKETDPKPLSIMDAAEKVILEGGSPSLIQDEARMDRMDKLLGVIPSEKYKSGGRAKLKGGGISKRGLGRAFMKGGRAK